MSLTCPASSATGELAFIRTPEGLKLGRPHYYRDSGREMVRLELDGLAPLCYPLAEVEILGTLLCGCGERGCA